MTQVRFAIPKGSLETKAAAFLDRANLRPAGYADGSRSYRPQLDIPGLTVKVLRPQEIPYMIAAGFYDMGISGIDWYLESECQSNVDDVLDLGFGRVDIVLAVPDVWEDVNSSADLFRKFVDSTGTHPLRIWTEYLNLTESLVRRHTDLEPSLYSPYSRLHVERRSSSPVAIFHSFGATESKPPEDGDAIIDNTETGQTLRANGLKIIEKVLPNSTARLLVNRRSLRNHDKQAIIQRVRDALASAAPGRREAEPVFGHM
ncbi:MAG TPA: ATP phosphoribosyltransferase [Bryobacterales bacterium]|nr:ATP phosphoribosyltransferase [Bryobacterales bacterium]